MRSGLVGRVALLGLGPLLGLALAACGTPASLQPPAGSPSAAASSEPSIAPVASLPASPVDGVIIAVDASSISDVRGFTLLVPTGQRIAFTLGTLENPTDFPPGHLMEHEATSEPVRVYFRVENGVPVVYRLGDASPAAS